MDLYEPMIRADLRALDTYEHTDQSLLDVPMTILTGECVGKRSLSRGGDNKPSGTQGPVTQALVWNASNGYETPTSRGHQGENKNPSPLPGRE